MADFPLEIDQEQVWEVTDPNTARLVAIFYDESAARAYLDWINQEEEAP